MKTNKALWGIWILMNNFNLLAVLFISLLPAYTLNKIVAGREAGAFFAEVAYLPGDMRKDMVLSLLSLALLLALIFYRNRREEGIQGHLWYAWAETLLCLCIMYTLNFNYNGIILLVIADLMVGWENCRLKVVWITALVLCYVFSGFDVISGSIRVVPFSAYLIYYHADVRSVLAGLGSVLISCNSILFLLYMIVLIRDQGMENERISLLNTQLDQANSQLQEANVRLKGYAGQMAEAARTVERNRLAREIHDTLGHTLTGIIAGLDACMTLVGIAPEKAGEQLEKVQDAARNGMKDVRRSVSALRPDRLERLSLQEALDQMIREMAAMAHVQIVLEYSGQLPALDSEEEETVYRIIQESITNAVRHGRATKVEIAIEREYGNLAIRIQDNGIGCKSVEPGFGLQHMTERLELLGGSLSYDGEEGFLLAVNLPIRWGKD